MIDIVYLVEETVIDMKDYIEEKGLEFIFDTDVEEKLINCDKYRNRKMYYKFSW